MPRRRLRRRSYTGSNNPNWKGGTSRKDGRVLIYAPGHAMATESNGLYVRRARLVAAITIGRILRDDEVVHHLNGNPIDDRPENLQVIRQSEHIDAHRDPITGRVRSIHAA